MKGFWLCFVLLFMTVSSEDDENGVYFTAECIGKANGADCSKFDECCGMKCSNFEQQTKICRSYFGKINREQTVCLCKSGIKLEIGKLWILCFLTLSLWNVMS